MLTGTSSRVDRIIPRSDDSREMVSRSGANQNGIRSRKRLTMASSGFSSDGLNRWEINPTMLDAIKTVARIREKLKIGSLKIFV